jgi:hypothetical protein
MSKNSEFETALQRLETALDAMVADGISPETVRDAAVMLGLGKQAGVDTAKSMRAILQISAPSEKPLRSRILFRMYRGFSHMLIGRDYPLAHSMGAPAAAETLRMLADSPRNEGMN